MIGIMAAMDEELHRVVAMLVDIEKHKVGHKLVYLGKLNNKNVVVVFSGWGKVASASTATMLIERYAITQLIFTGVAGGVASHINIGDIVIGETYVQHDMDCAGVLGIKRFELPLLSLTEISASKELLEQSQYAATEYLKNDLGSDVERVELENINVTQPSIHTGLVASGDQFISSQEKLHDLQESLPNLLAVEMEGAAVAQVAYEYDLPFIVIRVISDKANEASLIDFPRFIENVASHFTAGIIKRLI